MLLSTNDIKAELSYAVLHAVAARAGFSCENGGRHADGMGIDAVVRIKERFEDDSTLTEFSLDVQLKATSTPLTHNNGRYSFALKAPHYNKLRTTSADVQRLLMVLMLPEDENEWLEKSPESLVCRRCLRWISLRGAPEGNETSTTVYIPEGQVVTPDALRELAAIRSREEWITHDQV